MPIIYIEPDRVDANGSGILNSEATSVRYYIANAPGPAKVAGPFNKNLLVPNVALFEIEVSRQQLADRQILVSGMPFFNAAGESIDFADAGEGDFFQYTLESNGIVDKVPYYKDAYYYDLSTIAIDVETLPNERYLFIWESIYYARLTTFSGSFKCVSSNVGRSVQVLEVNHPGEVHQSYFKFTPGLYFDYENFELASDATLQFYRPFADVLQDIYDEQSLLDGINHIDTIPAQYIPYLAYLIGWDIPNFPGASDTLRRQILRKAVYLQKLKGSRRAIIELFEIFGYTIDLINLWASKDGNKFLGPNDGIPTTIETQVDALVLNYGASGFGIDDEVPLTFSPLRDSQLVLHAYLVNPGAALDALTEIQNVMSSDLTAYNDEIPVHDVNGILVPSKLVNAVPLDSTVLSHSVVKVGTIDTQGSTYNTGITTAINASGISYDKYKNVLKINFDHELSVDPGAKLFIFAAYERQILDLGELSNTRSNRFDVEIISALTDKLPDFELFMFLLNFLFKLKAFHSILRKIKFTVNVIDVYNVSDFCVNGKDEFAQCSTAGEFQVPPAIVPLTPEQCEDDNSRGFKQADFDVRKLILDGLEEEFQGWKALADNCALTPDGQDKVLSDVAIGCGTDEGGTDFDHNPDARPTYCEPLESKPDYCYKGRVEADLSFQLVIPLDEYVKNIPCGPNMGNGVFWLNSNDQLNFSDVQYFDFAYPTLSWLVYKPQSLQIEKDNLGFPGHRFLTMNRLEYEAVIDPYKRRPLDENLICGTFSNVLNAAIVHPGALSVIVAINGSQFDIRDYLYNDLIEGGFASLADALAYIDARGFFIAEHLTFDDANLSYHPNGLESDIPSLSDHGATVDNGLTLTHNVQQVTFPQVVVIDGETYYPIVDDFDYSGYNTDGELITKVTGDDTVWPIFDSACINSSGFVDFAGGYPSSYNLVPIPAGHLNYRFSDAAPDTDVAIDRAVLAAGFGIDTGPVHTEARYFGQTMLLLEKTDAQYKFYVPYRLDCNCLYAEVYQNGCEVTADLSPVQCNSAALYDRYGQYDPSPDKIEIDIAAVHTEEISTCNRVSNNDLPNLFCVNEDCSLATNGSFKYKDPYGIIYESFWVANEDTIDLTTIVKDPRLPGMEDEGYVDAAGCVFRKGIITTTRQIIKLTASGSYVDSEGVEIIIDFFQDNTICCDAPFVDPFAYKVNCGILDEVSLLITSGPRWVDPLEDPDVTGLTFVAADVGCSGSTYWADANECNVSVDQPFIMTWTDPMGSNEPDPCITDYQTEGCDASSSSSSESTQTTASTQSDDPSSPSSLSSTSSTSSSDSLSSISSQSSLSSDSSSSLSSDSSSPSSDSLSSISSQSSLSTATSETSTSSTSSTSTSSTSSVSSDSSTLSESTEIRSTQSTQSSNSSDSSLSSVSSLSSSSSTISSLSTRTSRSSQSSSISSDDSVGNTSHTSSPTNSSQSPPVSFTHSSYSSDSSLNSSRSSDSRSTSSSSDTSIGNESISSLSDYEPMAMMVQQIDSLAIDSVMPQSVPISIFVLPSPPNIAGWSYYASLPYAEGSSGVALSGDVRGTFDDSTSGSKIIDLVVDYHWFTADDGFVKNVIVRINRAIPANPNHDHYTHDHIDLTVPVSIVDLANVIRLEDQSSSSSVSFSSNSSNTESSLSTISQSLSSLSESTSSSSMEYLTSSTGSTSSSSDSTVSDSSTSSSSDLSSSTSSSDSSGTFSSSSSSKSLSSSSSSSDNSSSTSSRTVSSLSSNSSSSKSSFSPQSNSSLSSGSSSSTLFRSSNSSSSSFSLSTSSSSWQGDLPFDPNSITFNGCVNDIACQNTPTGIAFVVGEFDTVNALNGSFTRRGACAIDMSNGHVMAWNPDLKVGSNPGVGHCLYVDQNGNQESGGTNTAIVYIGGSFTAAAGYTRDYAAAFDIYGSILPWEPSFNGAVFDIDLYSTNVYIGGSFTSCISTTRRYFAGVSSIRLYHGTPISGYGVLQTIDLDADNMVYTVNVDVSASIIYVGGAFTAVKITTAPVSRGFGAAISLANAIQTWDPQANGSINSIGIDPSPLREVVMVGGDFTSLRGSARSYIGSFTRATNTLKTYGPSANGPVEAIVVQGPNEWYVLGSFTSITQNDLYSITNAGPYGAEFLSDSQGLALGQGDRWPQDPFASQVSCGFVFNGSYEYVIIGYCNALYFRAPYFETNVSSLSTSSSSDSSNTITSESSTSSSSESQSSNTRSSTSSSTSSSSSSSSKSLSSNTFSSSSQSSSPTSSSSTATSLSSNTRSSLSSSSSSNTPSSASSQSSLSTSSDSSDSRSSSSRTKSTDSSSSELVPTSAVTTNAGITSNALVGNKLYVAGNFTTVTDASGTYTRNYVACLDLDTGLWTSWSPSVPSGYAIVTTDGSSSVYVYANGTINSVNYGTYGSIVKLDLINGTVNDPGFAPQTFTNLVSSIRCHAGRVYISGTFTTVNGIARVSNAAISATDGTLDSWRPNNGDGAFSTETCTFNVTHDGKLMLNGALMLRSVSGYMSYGMGIFDPVTGLVQQMGLSTANAVLSSAKTANVMVSVGAFSTIYDLPAPLYNPVYNSNSYYILITDTAGENIRRVFSNTFFGDLVDNAKAVHIDEDDNVYITANCTTSIGGDTSRNGFVKLSGVDGSVISEFVMKWVSGPVVRNIMPYGNKLILTGSWTSLVNGQSRNNICIINKDTGALI